MARAIVAACSAGFVFLVGATGVRADDAVISTIPRGECQVPKPDDVAAPVTPSVAAGTAAANSKNFALAEANFRPVAESGNADGERALGQLLMQNCTGLQDKQAAVAWLSKAADANNIPAATQLGIAYMNGDGTAQDDNKAFALLTKGAAAGNPGAERALGYLYLNGRGVAQDRYVGMLWSIKAGERADATALSNIGGAYFRGDALPQDNAKAAYYISVALLHAAPADIPRFTLNRNSVARMLSEDDMQYEAKRAKDWAPGPDSLTQVIQDAAKRRYQTSWTPLAAGGK